MKRYLTSEELKKANAVGPAVGKAMMGETDWHRESAWLIELNDSHGPAYWHAVPDARCIGGFDSDPNKAMRFCREQDARAMAAMLGVKGMIALTDVRKVTITEHSWEGPASPATQEAKP